MSREQTLQQGCHFLFLPWSQAQPPSSLPRSALPRGVPGNTACLSASLSCRVENGDNSLQCMLCLCREYLPAQIFTISKALTLCHCVELLRGVISNHTTLQSGLNAPILQQGRPRRTKSVLKLSQKQGGCDSETLLCIRVRDHRKQSLTLPEDLLGTRLHGSALHASAHQTV